MFDHHDTVQDGYTEKGKAAEKGTMEGADILLTGAITAFEPNAEGAGGGGLAIGLPFGLGIGGKTKKLSTTELISLSRND